MISCPEILDKAGSSSRLLQFDGIPRQEVHRSVAAAAALHYQQQQSMQVCTSSDTSGMISLATFQGLQDHQTSQSFQAGGGPSPTESGAPTAVFSYLGDPKSKMRSALQPSALHPPTGTAGVSSLYGRLRSAALTSGTAASSCAAVPSVASSSMGGVSIASSDKDCSSKCQVLSHPQLWTPATAATCNAAAQHASAVAADKSDYLSLLMAATNPPKAADTLDGVSERSLGSVALTGSANVQHLPGHGLVDPGHHLRLMQQLQQLQNERTLAVAGGLVPHSDACSLSAMMNNTMGQPSLQNGSLLNPAPAGVPSPEGLLMQGQQLQLVDHNPNGVTLATQHGTFTASSQTGQQLPGPQSPLHCPSAAGVLRVPPCPASGVSASNLNASLKPDRAQAAITALAGSVHKPDGSNNPLYKTELCRTWAETGSCRYGARCQFAHGQAELRAVVRPPKYKTQPCRTYSLTGKCPYGARCNFIHDGEDHEALLNRNRTDSGLSSSIMSISRLSNCSSGLLGTPGAAMLLGVDAMPDAVAALGGTMGCAATTAGLWGGMPQASTGSAVSAQPGSLTGYPGVLSDDSFSSTLSAISMRTGAVNGLAIPQTVGHNVGGLGGCGGVAVDRSAVVNYAAGNNVLSAPAAMLGLVEAGGVFGGVLGSADACWAQGANIQQ